MNCLTKFRYGVKKGSGAPTIPVSTNHQNGDWLATDIYEGEPYLDLDTKQLYTRAGSEIIAVIKSNAITSTVYNVNLTSVSNVFDTFATGTIPLPALNNGDEFKITAVFRNTSAPPSNGYGLYFFFNNQEYVHPSASTPTYGNSFFQLPFDRTLLWCEITVHRIDATNAYVICKQVVSDNAGLTPTTYGEEAYASIPIVWASVTDLEVQAFVTGGGTVTLEYLKVSKLTQ